VRTAEGRKLVHGPECIRAYNQSCGRIARLSFQSNDRAHQSRSKYVGPMKTAIISALSKACESPLSRKPRMFSWSTQHLCSKRARKGERSSFSSDTWLSAWRFAEGNERHNAAARTCRPTQSLINRPHGANKRDGCAPPSQPVHVLETAPLSQPASFLGF
jgi:hypothetical protein